MSWRESPEGELTEGAVRANCGVRMGQENHSQLGVKRSPWKNQIHKDRQRKGLQTKDLKEGTSLVV